MTALVASPVNEPVRQFDITAEEKEVDLGQGKKTVAWTYNGSVPGPEIRVREGDLVVVRFTNKLPVDSAIHWHGIHVPGSQDGVPGVTQNAVKPGETFTYRFIANKPGTYWYHSHQDSANQVGKGLFGAIVVEPKKPTIQADRDETLVLHEWSTSAQTNGEMGMNMDMNMGDMNHSGMMGNGQSSSSMKADGPNFMPTASQKAALTEMAGMYDVFTVNGTSEGAKLDAKPGETIRLRLVNTGNMTHLLTLAGADFKVIALDGQEINGPTPLHNTLVPIGAGQRVDILFQMPKDGTAIRVVDADPTINQRQMISATIGSGTPAKADDNLSYFPWFDFTKYGTPKTDPLDAAKVSAEYSLDFGVGMDKDQMVYTINGKTFPNVPPIEVKQGDIVKIRMTNKSPFIHPMHLHGHTFKVTAKNGKPLSGSPIYMDTINILPGESYEIVVEANNPGLWMFHCHELHHAEGGLAMMFNYKGISTPYMTRVAE